MKILLAIDDSSYSREATRVLVSQFRVQEHEVLVLSVVEPVSVYISADAFPHFTPQVEEIEEDRKQQAIALVEKVAADLRAAGFRAMSQVDFGDAKTRIIDCATKHDADLIVMGSHGWKGLNRFLLGSVSDALARHAPCSVEIVRMRDTPEAAPKMTKDR
jgi:nucleotide-binding universal stress UspA family protein